MNKLLLTLLLLPTLLHAAPEERWYQVEVIIFGYKSNDYRNSELWPADYSMPKIEKSRELGSTPFTRLSPKQMRLGGAASRIKRAPDLEYVMHLGWLQPGLPEEKAVALHVYDGMLDGPYHPESARSYKLDGTLRLSLSRYLHLESDLIWRDPLTNEEIKLREALPQSQQSTAADTGSTMAGDNSLLSDSAGTNGAIAANRPTITQHVYRMQQSRRMRSNEIHYLDHPRFGVVALITPYETKASE